MAGRRRRIQEEKNVTNVEAEALQNPEVLTRLVQKFLKGLSSGPYERFYKFAQKSKNCVFLFIES